MYKSLLYVLYFIFIVLLNIQQCYAIEDTQENLDTVYLEECKKHILQNFGESTGSFLDIIRPSGYTFESGLIKNQKIRYFFHGANVFTAQRDENLSNNTKFIANELQSITTFADNKTTLMAGFNFSRDTKYNDHFFEKFSFLFLDHQANQNQKIRIGEVRTPIGIEGGSPSSEIKFISRSQIARTHGNYVTDGIQNIGSYKYADYNIGVYDGSRFFHNLFEGYEFAGLLTAKPLEKFDGKYGNLKLGGSIDVGQSDNSFTVMGTHASYKYKKFYADFEYLYANNCSGIYYGRGRSNGLYTTVSYFIMPKLELLARYDYFKNLQNKKASQEYTAGITYYLNDKTKLMLNYVFTHADLTPNPIHRIYIGADFFSSFLLDLL